MPEPPSIGVDEVGRRDRLERVVLDRDGERHELAALGHRRRAGRLGHDDLRQHVGEQSTDSSSVSDAGLPSSSSPVTLASVVVRRAGLAADGGGDGAARRTRRKRGRRPRGRQQSVPSMPVLADPGRSSPNTLSDSVVIVSGSVDDAGVRDRQRVGDDAARLRNLRRVSATLSIVIDGRTSTTGVSASFCASAGRALVVDGDGGDDVVVAVAGVAGEVQRDRARRLVSPGHRR